MTYPSYRNDPRWIEARFASKCAGCSEPVQKGERVYWYPSTKSAYGSRCGCADDAEADFNAAAADEAFYNGGYA